MSKAREIMALVNESKSPVTKKTEEFDVSNAIKEVIETNWSESDDEAGKVVGLLKGLIFSEDAKAKKFIKAVDAATSKLDPKEYE